jgi:type II secretory pathway component HofQ
MKALLLGALLAASPALAGPVKRISLDVQNADIHALLRLFAAVSHRNFVVGEEVQGKVTLTLRNVRWEDALDAVLASRGLGMEKRGEIIRVAPLARLDEEAQVRARIRQARQDEAPLVTHFIPVNYARADQLAIQVKSMLSPRGRVAVDERTNTLIVTDVDPGP